MRQTQIWSNTDEFFLVAKVHLTQYLKQPLLNLGFIVSLAIATSTLLCILVLNHASQQQYQHANSRLKSPVAFNIVTKAGQTISVEDFARLRALGFHQLTAVHAFRKTLVNGKKITFRALDILPLILIRPESFSSEKINISQSYASSLQLTSDDSFSLQENDLVPERLLKININDVNDWGPVALLDITLAWQLFPDIQGFSHLRVTAMPKREISRLERELPAHLSMQATWSLEERAGFADALHLNLSALAILGFIVSLFIAFQAANQTWHKRGELAAHLRLLGVELSTIKKVLWCESLLLTLLASIIGIGIAMALVTILLPLLGLTLEQLFQLRLTGHFQWRWQYSLWAVAISGVAVVLALFKQFKAIALPQIALSARPLNRSFNFALSLFITFVLLVVFSVWPSHNWHQLMFKYGLLLMASVALLPNLLRYLLLTMAGMTRSFRLKFIFKDASQQVGRRYLPIAGFYLALTASIAAALMVNSFESSFVSYLNQRLNSDMFISYNAGQKAKLVTWLKQQDAVTELVLFQKTVAKIGADTVALEALTSEKQYASLLLKQVAVLPENREKSNCYINEQLAYKRSIALLQTLVLEQGNQRMSCRVIGIYYDYGHQGFAVKIAKSHGVNELSGWQDVGLGLFFKENTELSKQFIIDNTTLTQGQVFVPEQIKQLALMVFEQTFILTQAIAFVLLSIACFGLFLSANSLELTRKAQLHILSSLGYSRFELFTHMLLQWLLLAGGAMLLSWPVATVLAKALVALVLPASFGWSMPLVLDIGSFAASSIIGLLILMPALGMPLYKLNVRASLL